MGTRSERAYLVVKRVLPNNFADFPSPPPWLAASAAARRRRLRAAARVALVLALSCTLALGIYQWFIVGDLVDQLPLPLPTSHRPPPPVDESATPTDPGQ